MNRLETLEHKVYDDIDYTSPTVEKERGALTIYTKNQEIVDVSQKYM
jgi:hypothetical protein